MKKMCSILLVFLLFKGNAQVILTGTSPSQLLDFSINMPVTAGTSGGSVFTSAGFEPDPMVAGRLNSNAWAFSGWSDGSLLFGGSRIAASTDYTRGSTANAVTTGGIYAYTGLLASAANPMMLIQPGGADWAPGTMTLKIKNGNAVIMQSLTVQYDLYVRNDQGRSSSFIFSHGSNDINYSAAPSLDYFSPAAPDVAGLVHIGAGPSRNLTITGLSIAPGAFYYLRWSSEDISGSGSRDEFGIDNILVVADFAESPLPVSLLDFRVEVNGENNLISWKTVFEQNNRGFELQRSENGIDFQKLEFIPSTALMGNSQEEIKYSYTDIHVQDRSWFYRLRQIDEDGRYSYSPVIVCKRNSLFSCQLSGPFPNPVSNEFYLSIITNRKANCFMIIVDEMGREVERKQLTFSAGSKKIIMKASGWPAGQYWICIYSAEGICLDIKHLVRL